MMDKEKMEKRESITARLKEFKDTTHMTYRQIADEIGIEDITWSVIAHLANGDECAEDKAEMVESWLKLRSAEDKEISQDNDLSDCELSESFEEYMQMYESVGSGRNPQGLTSLDLEARRIVERISGFFGRTLKDAASNYIRRYDQIMQYSAKAKIEGKTTVLSLGDDVRITIEKWR